MALMPLTLQWPDGHDETVEACVRRAYALVPAGRTSAFAFA